MQNKTLIRTEYCLGDYWHTMQGILYHFPELVEQAKQLDSKSMPTPEALEASKKISDFIDNLPVRYTYR